MWKNLSRKAFADPYSFPSLIRRLLTDYGADNWRAYTLVIIAMAVGAACTAASAYLVGHAINAAYVNRDIAAVTAVSIAIMVIFGLRGLSLYGQAVMLAQISNRVVANTQNRLFEKILTRDLAFFADRHSSEFAARITWGARAVSGTLQTIVTSLGKDTLSLVSLLGVMIFQSPLMSLLMFFLLPPTVLIARRAIKRVSTIINDEFGAGADILEAMQETVQGFKILTAFNLQNLMRSRVSSNIENIENVSNKLARISNYSGPMMETLGGVAVAVVIWLGGYTVVVSHGSPGEFFSFVTAFLLAYEPAKRLTRLNIDLNASLVGVRMLFEFLDLPDPQRDDDKPDLVVKEGRIDFDDVVFGYRADTPVLHGISFSAPAGGVTALVGPSGGGKSTILNLLLRFYDGYSGSISIDGTEISTVSRHSLRDHVAYVGQDAFLFRGTVRDNISLGRPDATEAEIIAAAKAAHAHSFIEQLHAGYETQVGEHGMQLSGGQRQRISVARALIRNASIILLDEPTSFLDTETERYINLAISRLFAGRTRLIIAHRLNTIVNADKILVIEDGRIVESGHHQALIEKGARYQRLFQLQSASEKELQGT